jgi:putative membrane protein
MIWGLILNTIAFFVVAEIVPGVWVDKWQTLLVVAVIWGLLSLLLKPVLILLTLPVNMMTLGLFTLVINASLMLLTSRVVPGFEVSGFWTAMLASVVLSLVSMFLKTLK